jgi:hypothetical protein
MKTEESKTIGDMVNELSESYADLARAMKGVAQTANATKQLWRNEKRSWLIKAGLALIAFPDHTISDVVGTAMVAAGLVQERIRRQTLHVDDVYKTFQNTLKEVRNTRESL